MDRKELIKFLRKNGFECINKDPNEEVYESRHICVFIDGNDNKNISFGHSASGYYDVENATIEQIESIISIFKSAEFVETHDYTAKMPKTHFRIAVLSTLNEYLENKR